MKVCVACSQPFASPSWTCPVCGSSPERIEGHLAFAPGLAVSGSGFKARYFAGLAKLEERNFWFRSRNRLANWGMERVLGVERGLIGAGLSFPAGGSLLTVARKVAAPRAREGR